MNNHENLMIISADVYILVKKMREIGWLHIRETSINRILYISAIFYSFKYSDIQNIFTNNYQFLITIKGPVDTTIRKALINLESNELIEQDKEGYFLKNEDDMFKSFPLNEEKSEWIETIAYLIGKYGEGKIYDFIFRDPEYNISLKKNSIKNLNIDENNNTVIFLKKFRTLFENNLDKSIIINKIDNKKYLELYLEYVFGKILRGENLWK